MDLFPSIYIKITSCNLSYYKYYTIKVLLGKKGISYLYQTQLCGSYSQQLLPHDNVATSFFFTHPHPTDLELNL